MARQYGGELVQRVNEIYKNNPQARKNALVKLRGCDTDPIIDLQLGRQITP
ncbi:hypothetical protein [Candidatus Odyssella thessalonicensis]|uniref:hypothetical protein n=1 Tax=Candidatus Odyssella thessalonicensis TaxID=84647 RepID=UPI000225AFA2|nr:hypothetical protein [Candidatus Odyssella thessalonicensis]